MRQRIWELDFARGLALVGMMVIHFVYDLVVLFEVVPWQLPGWYLFFQNHFGAVFLLISGISVTLGSHCLRRGVQVLCCGAVVTGVTVAMYLAGVSDRSIIIYFGVLQCLGCCMLLWPVFRNGPVWFLTALGLVLTAAGLYLRPRWFDTPWPLIPLGFTPGWFSTSDYFPLLPNLGYFLLGAAAGRRFYAEKRTRFPRVSQGKPPIRLLCRMGETSLWIYMLHQPVLAALVWIIRAVCTLAQNDVL